MKFLILFILAFSNTTESFGQEPDSLDFKEDSIYECKIQDSYPGGQEAFHQFIIDNFVYPDTCASLGISGYTKIRFTVEKNGIVDTTEVLEGNKSCPEYTKELIRVVRLSKWFARPYKSYYVIPIHICLNVPEPDRVERRAKRKKRRAIRRADKRNGSE